MQYLASGLAVGSMYAVLALSFWILFAVTRTFHLAHATVITSSGYVIFATHIQMGLPLAVGVFLAIAWAALLGALIERFVYRPVRNRGGTQLLIFVVSAGILQAGQAAISLVYGETPRTLSQGIPTMVMRSPAAVSVYDIAIIVLAGGFTVALTLALRHTAVGRSLRAVQNNPDLASHLGIDAQRMYLVSFAVGSAMAVVAATLMGLQSGLQPGMGLEPTLIAVVAVIVGGVENHVGAAIAGLLLGLLQNVMLTTIGAAWEDVFTFGLLFAVILFRPAGLSGVTIRSAAAVGR